MSHSVQIDSINGLPVQLRRYIERIHQMSSDSSAFLGFDRADTETSLSCRFQSVAERQPGSPAVIGVEGQLSYRELSEITNAIAKRLIRSSKGASLPMVLLAQQGVELPAGVLGIHKSGNIAVPVDPNYPIERLRLICDQTRPAAIVCTRDERSLAESLADGRCPIELIDITETSSSIPHVAMRHRPGEPAFVYFTSGSTGRPKGVVRDHRGRLESSRFSCQLFRLGSTDRWSALHSPGFATAGQDVYFALLSGAAYCPWNIARRGFGGLDRWFNEIGLTILNWVQSAVIGMVEAAPALTRLDAVRIVVLASESLLVRQVERFMPCFPDECIFFNRLGSTEVGTYRLFAFDKQTEFCGNQIPVGYELPEFPLMLVGQQGNEVDRGEVGELVIRSNQLSMGYWQDPELTSRKFRDDPKGVFSKAFFSGDLGRLRDDGCLEFLGRIDSQIRIRGKRIEIAEVENALLAIPGISDAAVVVRTNGSDEHQLVGFYASADSVELSSTEIQRQLGKHLPRFMIPSVLNRLQRIPRSAHHKVDYQTLAAEQVAPQVSGIQPPANRLQQEIAERWQELLQVSDVGANSDFFALGGDSLKAMQFVGRLEALFDQEVQVPPLFDHPVLSDYAQYLEQHHAECLLRLGWCENSDN